MFNLLAAFCLFGCTHTHAHHHTTPPPPTPKPSVSVSVSWVWVDTHWSHGTRVKSHWAHPHYGKSYRSRTVGPPPARPHQGAHWESGHYERRGHRRVWVPGHWS
jgi:hypothetical protein